MKKKYKFYLNKLNNKRKNITMDDLISLCLHGVAWLIFKFKKINWKKLCKKPNFKKLTPKNLKFLSFVTIGCFVMGMVFAQILNVFLETEQPVTLPVAATNVNTDQIYVVYLGTHEAFSQVLGIEGRIRNLGYGVGFHLVDNEYVVFSHMTGSRIYLEELEEILTENEIEYQIKPIQLVEDDLGWHYFFKAVHQLSYEMESEFIEEFDQDEMSILGYFIMLANPSLDVLASERQQMLREIYQWLNNHE